MLLPLKTKTLMDNEEYLFDDFANRNRPSKNAELEHATHQKYWKMNNMFLDT
jgi:hypothetical protein